MSNKDILKLVEQTLLKHDLWLKAAYGYSKQHTSQHDRYYEQFQAKYDELRAALDGKPIRLGL